jgi:GT2 family glycosyltransferase
MSEIGLDSRSHGESTQAEVLEWQLSASFRSGCAGAFVFAWTDEWYVTHLDEQGRGTGGLEVEDWDFGLTDRRRRPKPALDAVRRTFAELPVSRDLPLPPVSVVVCSHNGERTLGDCLDGLEALEYPDFEVIVVDDGSTDGTAAIATQHGFRVITTRHQGLASARNTGLSAATGEIVAYIDDDARPDPDWLTFLATSFLTTSHVGIGGPNVEYPGDGEVAECVAKAPGGPVHVLVSDTEAEHLPGCNCAFRKAALEGVGGFDTRFWAAGDDVDLCWRLRDEGWTLGFSPGAVVWHHARASLRAYWRQQVGYGKAEALLERKWPEKYNVPGHLTWTGRLYGGGAILSRLRTRRARVYHGTWGTNLFQSVYEPQPGVAGALLGMPEWYFVIGLLAAISALGVFWWPLLLALPLLSVALVATLLRAVLSAKRVSSAAAPRRGRARLKLVSVLALLHALQPIARLIGRTRNGLTLWRRRGSAAMRAPWPRTQTVWSERWQPLERWLGSVESSLRSGGASVVRGGSYDPWDLEVRGGALGSVRVRALVEEHGNGRQFVRLHSYPKLGRHAMVAVTGILLLSGVPALVGDMAASLVLIGIAITLGLRALQECAGAMAEVLEAIEKPAVSVAGRTRKLEQRTATRS